MTSRLDTAGYERARTWLHEIAVAVLPSGTAWVEEANGDRKYENSGGLVVNVQQNCFYSFGAGSGGYSPIRLLCLLKKDYSSDEAWTWLAAFLASHAGTGSGAAGDTADDGDSAVDDARARASADTARELLDRMVDISGTAAEAYLKRRGLLSPPPAGLLGFADAARLGEGGLISLLTAHERTVGIVVTYLIPNGHMSRVVPQRRRFNLERAKGATFRLPAPSETLTGPIDRTADYAACEGVEDCLSLWALGKAWTVIGLPGIAALRHLELSKGSRLVVVRDGDEPDSAAAKALITGVDSQLLNGVRVRVTPTPPTADANSILIEGGVDALSALIAQAAEATLSFDGRIRRLSGLEGLAFDRERAAIRTVFKASVATIDSEVKKLRPGAAAAKPKGAAAAEKESEPIVEDPIWADDVDLAAALNQAAQAIPRFLVAPEFVTTIIPLWSAVTHLVQSESIGLAIVAQLAFQSIAENAGKSTALEIVATLAYRGRLRSSYTAATVFRKISADQVTFCLSELHNILSDKNGDLRAVVDACHRRAEAFVDRTETDSNGRRYVVTYRCWAALSWASIGAMPPEIQSRAITLPLVAALPEESARIEHSPPSRCTALIDVRRQFTKWAATLTALPAPKTMPKPLFNRVADNWRPLFSVAEIAGAGWPERVLAAVEQVSRIESRPTQLVRLLSGIRTILRAAQDNRLSTNKLIDRLCEDDEGGWDAVDHGRRISGYWLRETLRGLLNPGGSQEWQEGQEPNRTHVRGYEQRQFQDAFQRYLRAASSSSSTRAPASGTSGTSETDPANPLETEGICCPGSAPDGPSHPGQKKVKETSRVAASDPDVPDVPDAGRGVEKGKSTAAGRKPAAADSAPKASEPTRKRRVGRVESVILATRAANPEWSIAQIAKRVGRAPSVVRRVLEDGAAP
jgi:hypothetical protein